MAKKVTPQKLSPARLVAARFGGIRPLGRELGIDPSSISKWIKRGGKIPNRSTQEGDTHQRLLVLAKKKKIKLTLEELTFGGEA